MPPPLRLASDVMTKMPLDVESGHRLTSNPLMLSVAISIFEQQRERRWEELTSAAAADTPIEKVQTRMEPDEP